MVDDFTTITFSKPVLVPVTKTCLIISSGQSPGLTEEKGENFRNISILIVSLFGTQSTEQASWPADIGDCARSALSCQSFRPGDNSPGRLWLSQHQWEPDASDIVADSTVSLCVGFRWNTSRNSGKKKKWIRSSGGALPNRTTHLGVFRSRKVFYFLTESKREPHISWEIRSSCFLSFLFFFPCFLFSSKHFFG